MHTQVYIVVFARGGMKGLGYALLLCTPTQWSVIVLSLIDHADFFVV